VTTTVFEESFGFHFEEMISSDMQPVAAFVHSVGRSTGQPVYVMAFEVDAGGISRPCEPTTKQGFPVRQGSGELPRGRLRFGSDDVIWLAERPEATAALIGEHLRDYWVNWAVVVDGGGALRVAEDVLPYYDRLWTLQETVGPQRALAMGKWEPGGFFSGRVAPQFWSVARPLLLKMPGARENDRDEGGGES